MVLWAKAGDGRKVAKNEVLGRRSLVFHASELRREKEKRKEKRGREGRGGSANLREREEREDEKR